MHSLLYIRTTIGKDGNSSGSKTIIGIRSPAYLNIWNRLEGNYLSWIWRIGTESKFPISYPEEAPDCSVFTATPWWIYCGMSTLLMFGKSGSLKGSPTDFGKIWITKSAFSIGWLSNWMFKVQTIGISSRYSDNLIVLLDIYLYFWISIFISSNGINFIDRLRM